MEGGRFVCVCLCACVRACLCAHFFNKDLDLRRDYALEEVDEGEVLPLPVPKRVGEVSGARPFEEGSLLWLSIGRVSNVLTLGLVLDSVELIRKLSPGRPVQERSEPS